MTWPISVSNTTHSFVWHDSFICVTWLIYLGDKTHPVVEHDPFMCVTRLNLLRDMMQSSLTWLFHLCVMPQLCVWHDSFICVTYLIHVCDMTHSFVGHDPFICVTWPSPFWRDSFRVSSYWSKETPSPGGVFYSLCSLIKSRVSEISRRDATVASCLQISYTRLLIREHRTLKTPPGVGGSVDQISVFDLYISALE